MTPMHVVIPVLCGWQVDLVLQKCGACSSPAGAERDREFGPQCGVGDGSHAGF